MDRWQWHWNVSSLSCQVLVLMAVSTHTTHPKKPYRVDEKGCIAFFLRHQLFLYHLHHLHYHLHWRLQLCQETMYAWCQSAFTARLLSPEFAVWCLILLAGGGRPMEDLPTEREKKPQQNPPGLWVVMSWSPSPADVREHIKINHFCSTLHCDLWKLCTRCRHLLQQRSLNHR